jgi:hypothetical protein
MSGCRDDNPDARTLPETGEIEVTHLVDTATEVPLQQIGYLTAESEVI